MDSSVSFFKNCMLSACLLHEIQHIENRWLNSINDFKKVHFHEVS